MNIAADSGTCWRFTLSVSRARRFWGLGMTSALAAGHISALDGGGLASPRPSERAGWNKPFAMIRAQCRARWPAKGCTHEWRLRLGTAVPA